MRLGKRLLLSTNVRDQTSSARVGAIDFHWWNRENPVLNSTPLISIQMIGNECFFLIFFCVVWRSEDNPHHVVRRRRNQFKANSTYLFNCRRRSIGWVLRSVVTICFTLRLIFELEFWKGVLVLENSSRPNLAHACIWKYLRFKWKAVVTNTTNTIWVPLAQGKFSRHVSQIWYWIVKCMPVRPGVYKWRTVKGCRSTSACGIWFVYDSLTIRSLNWWGHFMLLFYYES